MLLFLKKEENNTHLYLDTISNPLDIIKALISKQETTKKPNMNGDESSEESTSSCCSKCHGLSWVRRIYAGGVNRSEVELMSEVMPFITAPHERHVQGEYGEVLDAEVTEVSGEEHPSNTQTEGIITSTYQCNIITCCGVHQQFILKSIKLGGAQHVIQSFLPYLRLTVKIFQFLRLSTKFWAVLRLSVNPIETLVIGLVK